MKEFLSIVSQMCGQLDIDNECDEGMKRRLKEAYGKLTDYEKEQSLQILEDLLKEDGMTYFLIMSTLLCSLEDHRIISMMENRMKFRGYSLWLRWSAMKQLQILLFSQAIGSYGAVDYKGLKDAYQHILEEMQEEIGQRYEYLPYHSRKRKIVIVMSQIMRPDHSPTRNLIYIVGVLKKLGYEVVVYVCFHSGNADGVKYAWYQERVIYNLRKETGVFTYETEDELFHVYNFQLDKNNYLENMTMAVKEIWEEKPEFVFELGSETLLADLCNPFTTVVRMNFVKTVPITNAPIIARYFAYTDEEEEEFNSFLTKEQVVIDVKYSIDRYNENSREKTYSKSYFGIPENSFVIVIAGNRLNQEVDEKFIKITKNILDQEETFVFAVLGECDELSTRFDDTAYKNRFYFLGWQDDFKEAIGIGDVFLNPPRQGGGAGGLFAILEEVPVITLGHCDVEACTGQEFVCESLEEMPELVHRYFSDAEFMEMQKANCRVAAKKQTDLDSEGNFKALCDFVRIYTLEKEGRNDIF